MIVPVKKAKIFILEEDKVDLLLALQKHELLMISNSGEESSLDTTYEDDIILRAKNVLKELENYQAKKSFFEYLEVEYDSFIEDDIKRFDLLEHFESLIERRKELLKENEKLTNHIKSIDPFMSMPYVTSDLVKSLYVSFKLGYISEDNIEVAEEFFNKNKIEYEKYELSDYGYPLIFVLDKDEEDLMLENIKSFQFEEAELPLSNTKVKREVEDAKASIETNLAEIAEIEDELSKSNELDLELKILIDQLDSKKERMLVQFKKTEQTVYLEGWIREDHVDKLKEVVNEVTKSNEIDIYDGGNDELVPTATKNNKFVRQFETITNMFSVPNSNEIDPNPVMSVWYWIIFGIMMGDIGYGLVMITLFGLFIKLKKPKGSMSQLLHVFFYSGFTSIIAGFIFGSVFGASVPTMELIGLTSYNLTEDPMPMLYFSIGLGALHLISGLVLKMILSIKQKDVLTALADGLSWILILVGGALFAVNMFTINAGALNIIGLVLAGLGVLLILVLAGREKQGIFSKVTSGLGGIYNSTSYLSDLLSYSRILALSLSSAVIASTMNILAGLVQGSFIGILISIVIYLIGHTFNFAMGLLSAYVHDSRLQYIEFFNKFYEGGGVEYQPLSLKTENINEIIH